MLPIYFNRIHEEEAALTAAFGADLPSILSACEASAPGCLVSGISAVNHPAARTESIQVAWRDALVGSAFAVIM
ncbi:MAG: hypothetical protein ACYC97_05340 [Metallibacterium sp.]